jgi:hypothetical protein
MIASLGLSTLAWTLVSVLVIASLYFLI